MTDPPPHLESHELVVGFRGPRVDLDAVLERDNKELDALILDDLEVNASLKLSHVGPAITLLIL